MLASFHRLDVWLTICSIIFIGCSKQMLDVKRQQMVFLGHIYQSGKENKIDFRIENVNFDLFDVVLLGGDLCVETTRDRSTLNYLDSIFDLSDANTHWTWGNHDIRNGNTAWIEHATIRPGFYTTEYQSIRITVLNTNLSDCGEMQRQFDMLIQSLLPDPGITHHLIISHHAIWTAHLGDQGVTTGANARHSIWRAYCPSDSSSFEEVVLPELKNAIKSGVEVIWVAGDFGQKVTAFRHRSDEGIWYLGNGLAENGKMSADSIMTFSWDPEANSLLWQFTAVEEFVNTYK